MRTIRIGAGAGYSGDRIEPAVELAEHGDCAARGLNATGFTLVDLSGGGKTLRFGAP